MKTVTRLGHIQEPQVNGEFNETHRILSVLRRFLSLQMKSILLIHNGIAPAHFHSFCQYIELPTIKILGEHGPLM